MVPVFKRRRAAFSLACALALANCAGVSTPVTPPAPSTPTTPTSTTPQQHRERVLVTFHIRVPHHRRRAHYISSATKGIKIALTGSSTVTVAAGLTPASPGCVLVSSAVHCTITAALPAGTYTGSVTTYNLAPVTGAIPVTAKALSSASNVALAVKKGAANHFGFTLEGIASSLQVAGLPAGTQGTPLTPHAFSVTAKDAGGFTIVGTYQTPITISNSDKSGATTIATSGSDHPASGQLLSSSDQITLSYTGANIDSATVGASATGATSGNAVFTPATPAAPTLTGISAAYGQTGTTISETLTGTNFTPLGSAVSVSGTGITLQSFQVVNATTITVGFVVADGATTNLRNVSVTTPGGSSAPQPFEAYSQTSEVTLATDSNAGTAGQGAGNSGDLRYAMNQANANPGTLITFNCGTPCKIMLSGPLPLISANMILDGGTLGNVLVDGNSAYRAFFVDTGAATFENLQIQNASATGGAGGTVSNNGSGAGGGGGAGLGAGMFVNQSDAHVNVVHDYFLNDSVAGGAGGTWTQSGATTGSAGGGGLNFAGGGGSGAYESGGGGGGGFFAVGTDAPVPDPSPTPGGSANGGAGGAGGGGGGGGFNYSPDNYTASTGGAGGSSYNGGSNAGSAGSNANLGSAHGGTGGFGGGGGGGAMSSSGGSGGLFGGGGGGQTGGSGGAGGGGGGAHGGSVGGSGGGLATISGGDGGAGFETYNGGGGAAAGPAIFVNAGMLFTSNSNATGAAATGGAATSPAVAGGADATPVFNYAGTVNSSSTTGPVASALSNSAPSARARNGVREHRRLRRRQDR